jgi:hypothetical protein
MQSYTDLLAPEWRDSDFAKVQRWCTAINVQSGFCLRAVEEIERGLQNLHLTQIYKHYYSIAADPELHPFIQQWITKIFRSVLPVALLRLGDCKTQEEGKEQTDAWVARIQQLFTQGLVPDGYMGMLTARKPV